MIRSGYLIFSLQQTIRGLSKISHKNFLLSTFLGSILFSLVYANIGNQLKIINSVFDVFNLDLFFMLVFFSIISLFKETHYLLLVFYKAYRQIFFYIFIVNFAVVQIIYFYPPHIICFKRYNSGIFSIYKSHFIPRRT